MSFADVNFGLRMAAEIADEEALRWERRRRDMDKADACAQSARHIAKLIRNLYERRKK